MEHLYRPIKPLPVPSFNPIEEEGWRLGLAVESMKRHMTDEGWQVFAGLEANGYTLCGHNLTVNETDVGRILGSHTPVKTVVLQDKREWDASPRDFRDKSARFHNVERLREDDSIFKLTILKDAHQRPDYHALSAEEIGCHAWVIYYSPGTVARLAPYVRMGHLVRTYHSVDPNHVPSLANTFPRPNRALLSGAISGAYPFRTALVRRYLPYMPSVRYLPHPGYHMRGTSTPEFLQELTFYKVSICTSSVYDYTLRKFVESTVCGCRVITNLAEEMPEIDENFVRVREDISPQELNRVIEHCCDTYDNDKQIWLAEKALAFYNYVSVGKRLARDIEALRLNYKGTL